METIKVIALVHILFCIYDKCMMYVGLIFAANLSKTPALMFDGRNMILHSSLDRVLSSLYSYRVSKKGNFLFLLGLVK